MSAQGIEFLREQDGDVEREVKNRWIPILAADGVVERAYFALVTYQKQSGSFVGLMLSAASQPSESLLRALFAEFQRTFSSKESLDILHMDEEQEQQLRAVCRPFYDRLAG